jgi:chaperonin GroES
MKLRPLQDRVLVRRVEPEARTAGGIFIPDTAQEKPMEGEVVAVGPGARGEDGKRQPLDVKSGDRVLFGKWSGTEVKLDGEELMIMKEADIMGVLDHAVAEKSRLTEGYETWLPRKSDLMVTRASACCAASTPSRTRSR